MEGIDLSKYLKNVPEYITGRNRYNPVDMLKTVLFAFADNGYCSLRKLEDNCRVNMRYMYLMNWKTPSYRTFGYFINEVLAESAEAIFQDVNLAIFTQEKVDLSHLYIDGTKLEANANKYSWVWKKATEKSRYRLFAKITALLDEINEELSWSGLRMETNEEYVPEHLAEMLAAYAKFYQLDEAGFVHGKGRRKRNFTAGGQTGSNTDHVALCDAAVKEAFRVCFFEDARLGGSSKVCIQNDDLRVFSGERGNGLAKAFSCCLFNHFSHISSPPVHAVQR